VTARKVILAILAGLFFTGPLAAQFQTGSITGRVVDGMTSEVIAGAVVTLEGTRRGTTTGPDGTFTLTDVPAGPQFVTARLIGYGPQTQEVTVTAGISTTVEFALPRQAVVMDELVVTGYGAQRRAAIAGSIGTVNADEANVGVTTNANDLIQGRIAGVQITQNHGEPGAGQQIRIRGGTSISASNDPLYVIDGIPVPNVATESSAFNAFGDPGLSRSPLNTLNPGDIESITVLKDAAAAAIYGTQGANGVILIETKQGQAGSTTFEYDGYVSVSQPSRKLDLLTGDEYRQYVQEQVTAGNLLPASLAALGTANTDWEGEITRSAITHNHNVAFSGGTASTQYRASLNYMSQEGVALSSGLERFQGRLNATHFAWDDRLQLRLNMSASHVDNDYLPFEDTGGFDGGLFQNMVQFNPTQPVMVTDPTTSVVSFYELGGGALAVRNPVAMAEQIADVSGTTRVLGNVRAQVDIVPNVLSGQLIVGVDRSESTRREYYPANSPVGAEWNGLARQVSRELTTTTLQGLITYSERFGDEHEFSAVGGYEFADFNEDSFGAETRDFLTDAFSFDNLSAGAAAQVPFSNVVDSRLIGFFSRVSYGYRDRYFINAVVRRDGSSKFGADNKWSTFPAVAVSWRMSEENFMIDGPFSELKLRAGWGKQGNEAVPAYASLLLLAPGGDNYPFGDTKTVGVAPTRASNPALKWEETTQWNVGIDYGLSDNRISGSFDYYIKNTTDLLLSVAVPQPAVQAERLENIGKVRNKGLEATLDALVANRANMTWRAGIVFAAEKNEVVDLGGRTFITSGFVSGQGQSGQTSQRILPGFALGTFYGLEYVGISSSGQQEFNDYDVDGNLVGTTTSPGADDFVVIGDANPDFTLGFRSQMTWGSFDASFIARWEQGRDVFNNTALVHASKSNVKQGKNILRSGLDETDESIDEPAIYSSRWIEDGSFLRLQNITIGYTFELPGLLTGGRNNTARVYAAADNLLMLTGYTGYDPEAHSDAGLGSRGIDYLSYPRARSFTAGLRLSF